MKSFGDSRFPTTHWSALAKVSGPARSEALADLCRGYWYPVYVFVRRHGHEAEDARDLTQGFFTKLIESDAVAAASPTRGRFRSFLLASVRNFLANEWDKAQALKRGGGIPDLPLTMASAEDRYCVEPSDGLTPERLFERAWAITLIDGAMERLKAEHHDPVKQQRFAALKPFLASEGQKGDYSVAAAALGLNEGAARVAAYRLRARFGEILREQVRCTLEDPLDADGELRYLLSVFGGVCGAPARAY